MIDSKPYLCRHCKNHLGESSDKVLSLDVVKISQPVKMQCGKCGQKLTWRPAVKQMVPVPVYPV